MPETTTDPYQDLVEYGEALLAHLRLLDSTEEDEHAQ